MIQRNYRAFKETKQSAAEEAGSVMMKSSWCVNRRMLFVFRAAYTRTCLVERQLRGATSASVEVRLQRVKRRSLQIEVATLSPQHSSDKRKKNDVHNMI